MYYDDAKEFAKKNRIQYQKIIGMFMKTKIRKSKYFFSEAEVENGEMWVKYKSEGKDNITLCFELSGSEFTNIYFDI